MGNALFVVWRESVEAMLIVGILHAWLAQNDSGRDRVRALWLGVAAGIGLALALGWAMLTAQGQLAGETLEWFQTAIVFIAAGLITQMVFWMQTHGREMKQSLERDVARAAERSGSFGIAAIAALAIAREGAETVIFLYGMGLEDNSGAALMIGGTTGLLLAAATAWVVGRSLRFLNYRRFFHVTGFVLLLFAAALLVNGVDRLIGMGWLPPLVDPVWDSSALVDDGSAVGALLSALAGYRARPSLMLVATYVAYWVGVILVQRRAISHA